jgi:hypothetical protein
MDELSMEIELSLNLYRKMDLDSRSFAAVGSSRVKGYVEYNSAAAGFAIFGLACDLVCCRTSHPY